MKKRIVGGAVLAACMAGPAVAADLPVEAPIYVERPPAVGLLNWTGFYFGANLGYARSPGSTDILVGGLPVLSLSETMGGVIGGVQAGANWQTGNAVFGIEGDIQGTSQSVSASSTVVDVNGIITLNAPGAIVTAVNSDKITSLSTLRGRLGIASGRALYYVTGGGAFWTWSSNLTVAGVSNASFSNFQSGGAIGGGVELRSTAIGPSRPSICTCSPPPSPTRLSRRARTFSSTRASATTSSAWASTTCSSPDR